MNGYEEEGVQEDMTQDMKMKIADDNSDSESSSESEEEEEEESGDEFNAEDYYTKEELDQLVITKLNEMEIKVGDMNNDIFEHIRK